MKRLIINFIALFCLVVFYSNFTFAQCRTDLLLGQNILINGDFSQDYSGWTYTPDSDGDLNTGPNGYQIFGGGFSVPGHIFVGTGAQMSSFNGAFNMPFNDHSPSGDDKFLMVDGVCVTGIKLWQQANIPVIPNTRYYFSVWINSLKDNPNYPGILNFDVNGSNLATGIVAPVLGGGSVGGAWKKVETFWDSGPTPPATVTISIEGNQTIGCGGVTGESDFAIDDIAFIPGCTYGAPGPQPNLGPDVSICGSGGSITLNANVPVNSTTTVTWSDGTTGTGSSAPYTKIINAPGTYSVCVTDGASCTKSDVIVVSNTFTPSTSPNANLCSTGSTVLDAVFTGTGVTYQWKLNGTNLPAPSTNRTYTATSPGTYTVDVTAGSCGTVSSGNTVISSTSPVTPIDVYYCANSGSAVPVTLGASGTNSTNFNWYTTSTGGSSINTGSSYNISIPDGTVATQTYYVQDETVNTGTVGPNAEFTSGSAADIYPGNAINTSNNQFGIYFSPTQDFKLNSVQIPIRVSNGNPGTPMVVNSVTLRVYLDNSPSNPANETATSLVFTSTNPPVTIVGGGSNVATYSLYTFSFTNFNIPLSLGSNLVLKMDAINTNYELWRYQIGNRTSLTNPFSYVSTINPNPVSITNSLTNNIKSTTNYFGLYNWNISAQTPCSRIPVRAISNCPLPVTWAYFDAKNDANQVILNWNTLNEEHNATFVVLRSVDGIHWDEIGRLDGQLNSTDAKNYTYYDKHPLEGISYYKIRQIDTDQQFSETAIEAVNRASAYSLNVYPNPFENTTNVLLVSTDVESISYVVYNDLGVAVESGKLTNNQSHKIGEQLKAGFYTLCTPTEKIKLIKY